MCVGLPVEAPAQSEFFPSELLLFGGLEEGSAGTERGGLPCWHKREIERDRERDGETEREREREREMERQRETECVVVMRFCVLMFAAFVFLKVGVCVCGWLAGSLVRWFVGVCVCLCVCACV